MSDPKVKNTVRITPRLDDADLISKIKQVFHDQEGSFDEGKIQVHSDPFPHCYIENFLTDKDDLTSADDFIGKMGKELLDSFQYKLKQNDLFSFYQTDELMDNKLLNEHTATGEVTKLSHFRHLLKSKFLPWIRESTGMDELNDQVDMFSAQYRQSSYLLCHDDQLENRKIAYVFYLSPPGWKEEDGGSLDLMDTTKVLTPKSSTGTIYQPNNIVKSLLPKRNSMVLFAVSEKSFHQVSEVLSKDKTRLSVTGWFHGGICNRSTTDLLPSQPLAPVITMHQQTDDEEDIVSEWLNDFYLIQAVQKNIQETFEESSEIHLPTFLDPEVYERVVKALRHLSEVTEEEGGERMFFERVKLANSHNYDRIRPKYYQQSTNDVVKCPTDDCEVDLKTIQQLIELFSSQQMFTLLHLLTDLDLDPGSNSETSSPTTAKKLKLDNDAATTPPICRCQLRHWKSGSYTLLKDLKEVNFEGNKTLDLSLYLDVPKDWSEEHGGSTHYCAEDEDEPLIELIPQGNSASLVYSEEHCSSFVTYINHRAPGDFFELRVIYYDQDPIQS